jgi:hypothetical protein
MKHRLFVKKVWAVAGVLAFLQLAVSQEEVVSSTQNPLQIVLKRWYRVNSTTTFAVGTDPSGMAFDGVNIWVTSYVDATVTKLRANDGTVLGPSPWEQNRIT